MELRRLVWLGTGLVLIAFSLPVWAAGDADDDESTDLVEYVEVNASALPDSNVDIRRFRPSMVIDTGDTAADASTPGHPEFEWTGRRATIGSATIEFGAACPRCVMVTREIGDGIPTDRAVLRHIVRDLDQNLGVYATIVTPGRVTIGDELTLR